MSQLSLFGFDSDFQEKKASVLWTLSVDGASRNNPGPSGIGIFLVKNGIAHSKEGFYIGKATNNQAEYLALLIGLCMLEMHRAVDDQVHIISDSLLLVQQIKGIYKVRHPQLIPLHAVALSYVKQWKASVNHVLREYNSDADEAANSGIDMKNRLPDTYRLWLERHAISW